MKRITVFLLVFAMLLSMPALAVEPATAADSGSEPFIVEEVTETGIEAEQETNASVVSDADEVEEIPQGSEANNISGETPEYVPGIEAGDDFDAELFAEPDNIEVTVPAILPVSVLSDGTVQVATDAKIVNKSSTGVKVTGITVEPGASWELVDNTYNFATSKVNSKALRLAIQNKTATRDGTIDVGDGWLVPANSFTSLDYDVKIPTQESMLNCDLASITFTVEDLGATEASVDWEYTTDDTTNTITLTKYIGENLDVTVHNRYLVGNKMYKNVVMGESTYECTGPFHGSDKKYNLTSVVFEKGVRLADNSCYLFGSGDAMGGCEALTTLDISKIDTSNVTNMQGMFGGCASLTALDLSNLNTSHVTNMSYMFENCSGLTNLDLSNFNTDSVTDMSWMFSYCANLTRLDLSSFSTSGVTNMSGMFWGCSSLTSLDVSNFNTGSVTNMGNMFGGCSKLTSLDVSNFNTGSVMDMGSMFDSCSSLTSLDLSSFNTSSVTNMWYMFRGCSSLTSLDVNSFNTSSVTYMGNMFGGCSKLTTIYASNCFITDQVTSSSDMFSGCSKLVGGNGTSYNASYSDKTYARIDKVGQPGYFTAPIVLADYAVLYSDYTLVFQNGNEPKGDHGSIIKSWAGEGGWATETYTGYNNLPWECCSITKKVEFIDKTSPISTAWWFDNFTNVSAIDMTNLDTKNVTNMSHMFSNCAGLTYLDVSKLDVSNVTNMDYMFCSCSNLPAIDVSSWDTSSVTSMDSTFWNCSNLETLNMSSWDTGNITNMHNMFRNCSGLTTLNMSGWDTSNVTDISDIFDSCSGLTVLDVSGWDTSNITNMWGVFQNCYNLKTIFASDAFSTTNVTESRFMFTGCSNLVGGNGTKYDSSHVDKTCACIDKAGQPGYFTAAPNAVMDTASFAMETPGLVESGLVEAPTEAATPEPMPTEPKQPEMPIQYELTISGPSILAAGEDVTLEITKTPKNEEPITWSSSDKTIAMVDRTGLVTGVADGEVAISAQCGETVCEWPMTVVEAGEVDGQWEYETVDDILTLTRYIGKETDVTVYAYYMVEDQLYNQVCLAESVYEESENESEEGVWAGVFVGMPVTSITYKAGVTLPENMEGFYEGCADLTDIIMEEPDVDFAALATDNFRLNLYDADGVGWKKSEAGKLVEVDNGTDIELGPETESLTE